MAITRSAAASFHIWARGAFESDVYQSLIGFEVATPVLERAFRETYGLELEDVFGDTDLAIRTYRQYEDTFGTDLLAELADRKFARVPPALRRDINEHDASRSAQRGVNGKVRKQEREAVRHLAGLNSK